MMLPVFINDVPIECINRAAIEYRIPATYIIAVLKTENGRVGMKNKNKNGTYDLGPMQINSTWLQKIAPYGYTEQDLQYDPCKNVEVGTWILSTDIAAENDIGTGVGNYHSHTVKFNEEYQRKAMTTLVKIDLTINY